MATQIQTPPPTEAEAQPRNLALASIRPANLLSFAPDTEALPLEPLNILIGANGSGKSNLLDAIGLLQAAALGELTDRVVVKGRGVSEWIWKGAGAEKTAKLEVVVPYPDGTIKVGNQELRYSLAFEGGRKYELRMADEQLGGNKAVLDPRPQRYLMYENGTPIVVPIEKELAQLIPPGRTIYDNRFRHLIDHNAQESALSQRWSADEYPELAFVSRLFSSFRLYRDWSFGRNSPVRNEQRLGVLEDQLAEDASNLGLVLNNLKDDGEVGDRIHYYLKEFLEDAKRISMKVFGEFLHYGLSEGKLKSATPAGRLSDGTLRWMALMAVLLNPNPPPLICLEEPEAGLHPQLIQVLAELLLNASQHTQIVVTTHSRDLVDRFNDTPEYVVVFNKEDDATKMRRLDSNELGEWLDDYTLGSLWAMGVTGGNRY